MSPLRWMQSTAPHWSVILEEVLAILTGVGASEGTEVHVCTDFFIQLNSNYLVPASLVIAVTG